MKAFDRLETKRRLETLGIVVRSNELTDLAREIATGIVRIHNGKVERRGKGANRDLSKCGRASDF